MKRKVIIELKDGNWINKEAAPGDILLDFDEFNGYLVTEIYYLEGDQRVAIPFEGHPISAQRPLLKDDSFTVNFSIPNSGKAKGDKIGNEKSASFRWLNGEITYLNNIFLEKTFELELKHLNLKSLYGDAIYLLIKQGIKEIPLPHPSELHNDPEGIDTLKECIINLVDHWGDFDSTMRSKLRQLLCN